MINDNPCKKCRRAGVKLFLKGERCTSVKCALTKRNYQPGQHGQARKKYSEYAIQLSEKQKAKAIYGLREQQFKNYYKKASKSKSSTGERLLQLLELRLDNIVYRLGYAPSRAAARQMVLHGKVKVNNIKVNIPSYILKEKDQVTIFAKIEPLKIDIPLWLKRDPKKIEGSVIKIPLRDEMSDEIDEAKILEFYAR